VAMKNAEVSQVLMPVFWDFKNLTGFRNLSGLNGIHSSKSDKMQKRCSGKWY
jgi:hypothetical protein